jgi:hypothetical protein
MFSTTGVLSLFSSFFFPFRRGEIKHPVRPRPGNPGAKAKTISHFLLCTQLPQD